MLRNGVMPIPPASRTAGRFGLLCRVRQHTNLRVGCVQFIAENGGGVGVRLKLSRREVLAINRWEAEGGAMVHDAGFSHRSAFVG